MASLETLKQGILAECEEDHVGIWSIIRDVEDFFPKKDESAIRKQVLSLLRELLLANEISAGFPTEDGKFRPLRADSERILEQIEAEWPVGQRPTIGEGLWFNRTKQAGKTADEMKAR